MNLRLPRFVLAATLILAQLVSHAEEVSVPLASGDSLSFDRYAPSATSSNRILLWFASERGFAPSEQIAAHQLAERGMEVWQIDLVNALFLPQIPRSLDNVPQTDMAALINNAHATGKSLTVYATARAAVPVLTALKNQRACVLLMHPNLYNRAEALAEANYLPFENLEHMNILVLQPIRSAATPWINNQLAALKAGHANVQLNLLEKLREGFWRREDATAFESNQGQRLADLITQWIGDAQCHPL